MLNRLVAPASRSIEQVTLPAAEVVPLANGARLHILVNTAQPVIRFQIVFPAGRWYDPTPGISLLVARTLLEGTRTRTARQIADEAAFYGASLECEQGFDRTTLTLYCLSKHFEALLPLIHDVATHASFPAGEVEQFKTRTIQNIRVERQKTSYLAAERLSRNLFGVTHPYGIEFDEQRFASLEAQQARDFYHAGFCLSEAELFLCGHVEDQHRRHIEQLFAQSDEGPGALVKQAEPQPAMLPVDYVPVKDSLQATLRLGRLWPAATHPDNHALQVLVKVLGGYFGSRLMKNIREDKGFTYGIYASIAHREHASQLVIGSDVNAENARAAVAEVHLELNRLQQELIPEDELSTVKNYITGKFLNELGTVFEQCDKYKYTVLLGLPADYYTQYLSTVNHVTTAELQRLAQAYLSPEALSTVIAGPPQG
ncbi:M16 family metallopeptidase [Hymenobacter sp. B81]|uniref:M16 family metallopeptidase n=1 Tax=Hymenobacter sp. B81 TaxID=3344878 RepID=UPI0037DDB11A